MLQQQVKDVNGNNEQVNKVASLRFGYGRLVYISGSAEYHDGLHNIDYEDNDEEKVNINNEIVALIQEGQWDHGKLNGYGRTIDFKGNMYLGHYLNGSKHGVGIYIWTNGNIYEGQWFED